MCLVVIMLHKTALESQDMLVHLPLDLQPLLEDPLETIELKWVLQYKSEVHFLLLFLPSITSNFAFSSVLPSVVWYYKPYLPGIFQNIIWHKIFSFFPFFLNKVHFTIVIDLQKNWAAGSGFPCTPSSNYLLPQIFLLLSSPLLLYICYNRWINNNTFLLSKIYTLKFIFCVVHFCGFYGTDM